MRCELRTTFRIILAPVAQWIEQRFPKPQVACSIHAGGAGLTQQAMAQQAGTSRTTLSAYERGRKSPNLEPVVLPLALNWSRPGHEYDVRDRHQRARLYELVLPRNVRAHWQSLIETAS